MLTDAEVLVHVRQVHQQALLNHQYVDEQGAKLRGLYNVVKDVSEPSEKTNPVALRNAFLLLDEESRVELVKELLEKLYKTKKNVRRRLLKD